MDDQEEHERRESASTRPQGKEIGDMFENQDEAIDDETAASETNEEPKEGRKIIGRVEHFFSKINVAAIELSGDLKIGDVIEISDGIETTTLTVTSMQINKQDVAEASEGDSIGIKVNNPVKPGSSVYLVG